jgi:hypothetical protein
MALLPAYYTTSSFRKRKARKPTKSLLVAREELQKTLAKVGYRKLSKTVSKLTVEEYDTRNIAPLSNTIPGGAFSKKDIFNDHKWKTQESKETIKEIEYKASRVMPLYNKGGLQYATPAEDMTKVGTKSRR